MPAKAANPRHRRDTYTNLQPLVWLWAAPVRCEVVELPCGHLLASPYAVARNYNTARCLCKFVPFIPTPAAAAPQQSAAGWRCINPTYAFAVARGQDISRTIATAVRRSSTYACTLHALARGASAHRGVSPLHLSLFVFPQFCSIPVGRPVGAWIGCGDA